MNVPSFLHMAMCIESDHSSMNIRRCISTMALYFRRLWQNLMPLNVIQAQSYACSNYTYFGNIMLNAESLNVLLWNCCNAAFNIRASGEANDERTNHIFVFRTRVKGDEWRFALCVRIWMFVGLWKQSFCMETEADECSCKWRGEARARMYKCGIIGDFLIAFSVK